ncbi:MAG: hypothetical protein GYB36_02720 [Alphaproteobacteria bacterium]|nr:hypothetical protein [Alphaproteobacteria bacterium]
MSTGSILSLIASAVIILGIIAYLVTGANMLPEYEMSRHGWIALGLGTGFSFLVGGALTAVLVIGRRRGFDESAHEIYQQLDPAAKDERED